MANITTYLKDYSPLMADIKNINLTFDIYDSHTLVENRLNIVLYEAGEFRLNGDELELVSVAINDAKLSQDEYFIKDGDLVIKNCPKSCTLTIVTKLYPEKNTALSGLFCSKQTYCTQCEAEGFRRITFFPDRPDVLTFFSTKIIASKTRYPVLLSNGNLIDKGDYDEDRHWVLWEDPFKKPSYLFALVAGDLVAIHDSYITNTSKKVELSIFVEPGNEDACDHAMASLKNAMRWDEEVYGRVYDLSIFMIVAVADFNMGAMENKGLNIFNSKYILGRPESATDEDFAHIEGVVAHEYFHNWTGNRVTCRDWFQLSLKEGLTVFRDQEFSRDMNSRDVNRIKDVEILINHQFPEDAGAMAHPVRPASYQEINNFYTATIYNKGAEVIRMQHTLLGPQRFRKGMDLYFTRHDGQAVTIEDFVAAMEDANKVDFSQFRLWYSQAGTPTVKVETSYENQTLKLTLSQSCPKTPESSTKKPFHIPLRLALFDKTGKSLDLKTDVLELREASQRFEFTNLSEKPYVSLLRDFSAPIKLKQNLSQEELKGILKFETNGYAKWSAAKQLASGCIENFYTNSHDSWELSPGFIDIFANILEDESLDPALKAILLTPPSFEDFLADIPELDVDKIIQARDFYRDSLTMGLFDSLMDSYNHLVAIEDHSMSGKAYANRSLKNICMSLLMFAKEEAISKACQQQFYQAKTMTDQLASFKALCSSKDLPLGQKITADFYSRWSSSDLVLDKWFAIQAGSILPNTLEKVKNLEQHAAFSIKNPNKVRALIGAFSANPRHFHAKDGSGYDYLKSSILKIDKLNPQIAARLATPFTRWQSFDKNRQEEISKILKELSTKNLSRDLKEVVEKSLPTEGSKR